MRHSVRSIPTCGAFLVLLASLLSCKDEVVVVVPVATVDVQGPGNLVVGQTGQFTATPRDDEGNRLSGRSISWSTSNGSLASVNASGQVIGVLGGQVTVSANCEGRSGSSSLQVNNPAPSVQSIEPLQAKAWGSDFQLTVLGSGFVATAQVLWNGDPRPTSWVSSGEITASIPAGDLSMPGTSQVSVVNPEPGGGTSGSRPFTVLPPYSADSAIALISDAYNIWFNGTLEYDGPGLALMNAAFQNTTPWKNIGMEQTSRIPRVSFINDPEDQYYGALTRPWDRSYRALAGVAEGLLVLGFPEVQEEIPPQELARAQAFGKFVQGICHATVATLFSHGFVVDEWTNGESQRALVPYPELWEQAAAYLDEAIVLSDGTGFSLPFEWMQSDVSNSDLGRLIHTMQGLFRAGMARTPEERGSVNWTQVLSDLTAGYSSDFTAILDPALGWNLGVLEVGVLPVWNQMGYFIFGMADQSGNYQDWASLPFDEKSQVFSGGEPVLILTPDLRFPEGNTVEAQRANPGRYFEIVSPDDEGDTWDRPERGTWRWSWYKQHRGRDYSTGVYEQPLIRRAEVMLLMAEGLYRTGDRAGAAALLNESRVGAGLSSATPQGDNSSCVPRLPNGDCGDLWEMLKWEKRMETTFSGLMGAGWFWDARGWGDLWKGTLLQFPVPCHVARELGQACETFGGPDGAWSAALSTYQWPFEG